MEGYTLTYRTDVTPALLDGAALRPDRLAGLSRVELASTPLPVGRTHRRLDELFEIDGDAGRRLTLRAAPPLLRLGAKMAGGELIVEGDAGDDLGASMTGGLIRVKGDCGHRAGGPDADDDRGMRGGEIVIEGDAGDFTGFRMRRGLIAVTGRCGKSAGHRMMAGTLVLGRGPYDHPGLEARRGTILCLDRTHPFTPHPGYARAGDHDAEDLVVMRLMRRRLAALGIEMELGAWTLYDGDALELNKVELWQNV